jgi:predicted RNA-binding protein with PIN domain
MTHGINKEVTHDATYVKTFHKQYKRKQVQVRFAKQEGTKA